MKLGKVLVLISLLLVAGCVVVEKECTVPEAVPEPTGPEKEMHDLFDEDILALFDKKEIDSSQVSVNGVKLGDNFITVTQQFGVPDLIEEFYEDDIVNARYIDLETNTTKIIFHLKGDEVTRITIREGLGPELRGMSKIDYTLAEITSTFGKPDMSEDLSFFRRYVYDDLGFEIYHKRKRMLSYAFVASAIVF